MLSYRRSSSLGFINACCHPVAKTETGLPRTLICLFGHDGTHIQPTHHPSPLFSILFYSPPRALFLVTHTVFWVCCSRSMSLNTAPVCSSHRIAVSPYIPEALPVSVSTETFKVSVEVIGGLKGN